MSLSRSMSRSISPPPQYDNISNLRPYLELPHILSLTWLAYPVISLIFVAFRLHSSLAASKHAAGLAKNELIASCIAAERAATAAASMPRYMAAATNRQIVAAVNSSLEGARLAFVLALTAMEGIINFLVDIYRSTFLCFVELVVRGGLAILIGAVQQFNAFLNDTAGRLRTSIQSDIDAANSVIRTAFSALNRVNPFGNVDPPQFTIPSLSGLQNLNLPTTVQDALVSLNNTIPSPADLKDKINALLDTPFELVKRDINDTFAGIRFNESLLPIPPQNALTFCDRMDTSVLDDLTNDLVKIAKLGTIILVFLALLLIGANCLFQWYRWRCLKRHLERTRQAWTTDPTVYHLGPNSAPQVSLTDHNLLMLQSASAHPLLTRIANALAALLKLSPTSHVHLRWFFHYIFHPPALACFLIGLFGLLSVQIQLIAVSPLQSKFNQRANAEVADFSRIIVSSVNDSMYNQSSFYATSVNGRVDVVQTTINQGLFGWVNETTTTLNTTLNDFYNDVQNVVSIAFNGTVLEAPAREFIRCLIGSKVDAIENALTFLHDNLKVDVPRVNQSVLVLSQTQVDEATRPIALAALGNGGGGDGGGGLVGRLVNTYVQGLKKERIVFGIFMGLWAVVVLMGLAIVFWHSCGRGVRGKGKWRRRKEQQSIVVAFQQDVTSATEKPLVNLPDLTPLPSPGLGVTGDAEEKPKPKPKPKPKKLMAVGRGSLGVERFVNSGETPSVGAGSSWATRLRSLRQAPQTKNRPNLRIVISSTEENDMDNDNENQRPPKSAWSVTPPAISPPRRLPWSNASNSNKAGVGIAQARHVASVPSSVYSSEEFFDEVATNSIALPLHHGFRSPEGVIPVRRDTLAPPPPQHHRHRRAPTVAAPAIRVLTNPFDDEHRANKNVNPFTTAL